jgi:ATP adenylyltransferase/5',5'''-P-1,P-4-tetraphosphate phosphorylase II
LCPVPIDPEYVKLRHCLNYGEKTPTTFPPNVFIYITFIKSILTAPQRKQKKLNIKTQQMIKILDKYDKIPKLFSAVSYSLP